MAQDESPIPPHLQALWEDPAQRHQLDPNKPATSLFQSYTTVANELAQELADVRRKRAEVEAH